jgi:hypothetical protein
MQQRGVVILQFFGFSARAGFLAALRAAGKQDGNAAKG